MTAKETIRKQVLSRRDALTPAQRMRSEILVTERILGHQWYYLSSELLLFWSFGSELSTTDIFEDAIRQGKKVYLPKVLSDGGEDRMDFYRVTCSEELVQGRYGIWEPNLSLNPERFCYRSETPGRVLMIMPGVAFDPTRNRIGYGKGYYDRYLADKEELRTIAVGFDCQMVAAIETEENDIKPMQVICL